ncbi:MAG: ABC transporter permease [Clostridia bacterium]|nr:ABC transporter permease [Clostridia bacterium]
MGKGKRTEKLTLGRFFDVWGSILTFSAMIAVFCILSDRFSTVSNVVNIFTQSAPMLIIAMGVTLVNMSGESDLSMGGVVGLCASLFCGMVASGSSPWLALLATVGVGLACGLLCGALVAYAGLSSFITTISVMFLTQGLEYAYSNGQSLWVRDNPVTQVVTASVGPVPVMVIMTLALFLIVYLVMHQTKTGLHIQSVGLSQDAARFAGIPVKPIKLLMFGAGGVFYALGGILNALRSSGSIIYSGQRLLLPVLAVTYIAKTILGTKRPNIPGILVGALVLTSISTAFTLLGLEFYYTSVAQGIVLLFAAVLSVSNRSVILQEDLR